jgi:diguanylate cyclase (GGDEF)-like protein
LETGRPDQFELTFEVDGCEKIFQVGIAPFAGGVTVTFADVAALVRANQSLEQQRHEMQSANEALEDQTRQLIALAKELEASRSTLAAEARRREELEEELRRIANTDDLTSIANRRAFTEGARQEIARAERFSHPLSVIVFDIDRFKSCNDTYGHAVGDYVLRTVARRVSEAMRSGIDIFGRIGGEEFAVLLPETDCDGAVEAAERLRGAVAELAIGVNGTPLRVTASFGVAAWSGFGESLQGMLHRADAALYSAKRLGRNRVEADTPIVGLHDEIIAVDRAE